MKKNEKKNLKKVKAIAPISEFRQFQIDVLKRDPNRSVIAKAFDGGDFSRDRSKFSEFKRIRNNLTAIAMEVSKDVIEQYHDLGPSKERKVNINVNNLKRDKAELEDKAASFKAVKKPNFPYAINMAVGTTLSGVLLALPSFVGPLGIFASLAGAGSAIALYKFGENKSKKVNDDFRIKRTEFVRAFEPYREKADLLEREVLNNYDFIMQNKKKMKKKEFEEWQKGFARELLVKVENQYANETQTAVQAEA